MRSPVIICVHPKISRLLTDFISLSLTINLTIPLGSDPLNWMKAIICPIFNQLWVSKSVVSKLMEGFLKVSSNSWLSWIYGLELSKGLWLSQPQTHSGQIVNLQPTYCDLPTWIIYRTAFSVHSSIVYFCSSADACSGVELGSVIGPYFAGYL